MEHLLCLLAPFPLPAPYRSRLVFSVNTTTFQDLVQLSACSSQRHGATGVRCCLGGRQRPPQGGCLGVAHATAGHMRFHGAAGRPSPPATTAVNNGFSSRDVGQGPHSLAGKPRRREGCVLGGEPPTPAESRLRTGHDGEPMPSLN